MTSPSAIHPFERAGLGRAPFRCTGSYTSVYQAIPGDPSCPLQPGSSCDYCGNGIMQVYEIKSSDGKTFKVGCDCVARTYRECAKTELERDARKVVDAVNKIKTAASHARKDERIAAARAKLEQYRAALSAMWHTEPPFKHAQSQAEWLDWMFKHSGRAGRLRAAASLDALLAGLVK